MNEAKFQALKSTLDEALKVYEAEKARLVAAGMKSQQRYEALKPLKAIVDAANTECVNFAYGQVKQDLKEIIKQAPKARKGTAEHAEQKARRALFMYTK